MSVRVTIERNGMAIGRMPVGMTIGVAVRPVRGGRGDRNGKRAVRKRLDDWYGISVQWAEGWAAEFGRFDVLRRAVLGRVE
jgi:hypothetical protein